MVYGWRVEGQTVSDYFRTDIIDTAYIKDRQQEAKSYSRYLRLLSTPSIHDKISNTKCYFVLFSIEPY